ncbi:MAG TPA: alpha-glucosidase [Sphingomicrobium sp.]
MAPGANRLLARVGRGDPSIQMFKGNFVIEDRPTKVVELRAAHHRHGKILLSETPGGPALLEIGVREGDHADGILRLKTLREGDDRIWLSLENDAGESFWGGGEQMSYLRLNGRRFPMWTSEPGVGRDKADPFTKAMDEASRGGGDYWTTNYPQPTFLSSRGYALHADVDCYCVLNFEGSSPELEIWQNEARLELYLGSEPATLVSRLSTRFGRQPPLPDWAIGGAILGLKEGLRSFERLDAMRSAGVEVAAIWCEDWAGIRETSFGRRLNWDWHWSSSRYPDLPERIARLNGEGIRFLAYANPYLLAGASLFTEALAEGHLALRQESDQPYLVDFGEFEAGLVDFTSDAACLWFSERVLGRELLDIGISGWMADFGEYLPVDVRLADGSDPMLAHNRWPVLWAKVNADALRSRGRTGDAVFFMRAGFSGVQEHCPLLWAGDQCVDFSRHDGINTVITAALSAGLVGNAYSHGDCGGYTSVLGKVRTEELLMRWCELAAFAPVMRTHEGNRPDDNLQVDSSPRLLECFASWSRVHKALAPYVRCLSDEAAATGLPVQRALFLHYPDDAEAAAIQDQYLYGEDMIVAPIVEEGATGRSVYLPGEKPWLHVWSGNLLPPGRQQIDAPLGEPPIFYKPDSRFADLFASLPTARDHKP